MSIIFSSLNGPKRRALFMGTIVVLSLLAGMVGSYFASSFGLVLFGLGTVNEVTPDYNTKSSVIIREAKNVVVMQNEQVQQTASAYQSNSLVIMKKITKNQTAADKFYNLKKPFAEAMPITIDGWLVTNLRGKFKKDAFKSSDYILIDQNKNQFNIDRVVKDDKTGLYYLHIKTTDLSVYKNNLNIDQSIGQVLIATNHEGVVTTANLAGIINTNVDFSDRADKQIVLDRKIDPDFTAVLSLSGELVGFVNQDSQIISAATVMASAESVLKFGAIKRPALGLYCQNLDNIAPIDGKKSTEKGCIIFNGNDVAIIPGSSAEKAGLKVGDIITSLNQEPVSGFISDRLVTFLPGDKLTLTVDRDGKLQDFEIVLSELK